MRRGPNQHSAGAWASNQFTQLLTDRPSLRTSSASAMIYLALVDFSLYRKRPAKEQPDAVLASISKKILVSHCRRPRI